MKAVRCPVCNGEGKLNEWGWSTSSSTPIIKTCHGCSGKGWVEISEDYYKIAKARIKDTNL